jgi:methyltransferase (TIGR00027 family)
MSEETIENVSDTALWVAFYRAQESKRPDALFHDPYAERLIGERGRKIAEGMKETAKYTAWTLAIRTRIIDELIQELTSQGVDTVLNLGAGLDARPYRLELPATLRWIEVDYPHMIDHKERVLANEKPHVRLEHVRMDLADREKRISFFAQVSAQSKKVLVLTESVIPYLTENQVSELAEDLDTVPSFELWIAEYYSPFVYSYFQNSRRLKRMKNAPFRFFPKDWFGVFAKHGWTPRQIRFLGEESLKWGRRMPGPWWAVFLVPFMKPEQKKAYQRMMAYVVFERRSSPAS